MNHHRVTDLIVALDFPRSEKALEWVDQLLGLPLLYKVGLELFMAGGPDFVRELIHRKNRVFLDLKFHDIPHTVARAVRQAALLNVEMITLHLAGGSAMVRAVTDELSDISLLRPKILGVSVLTSFDDVRWAEVSRGFTGHSVSVADSVLGIVEHSLSWGVDGIVCSALELEAIKSRFPKFYTVVPGIRPEGAAVNDQARVTTPAIAHAMGADAVVIGRPITDSLNPRGVVEKILKELNSPIATTRNRSDIHKN